MLCAAIMMRDEEETVIRTLATVINHVDSVVVLDTGSQDDSINLVKAFCDGRNVPLKLEEMEWVDFSTNRNKLLEMCEGVATFSLLLDANDQVKNIEILEKLLKEAEDDQNLFKARYVWDNDNNIEGNSRTYYKPCVIRNNGLLRYKYPVHETLYFTNSDLHNLNCDLEETDFYIYQDRSQDTPSLPRIRDKDIPILIDYMEKEGESPRMLRYLCQSFDVIKDIQNLYIWSKKLVAHSADWFDQHIYLGYLFNARSAFLLNKPFEDLYLQASEYSKKSGITNAEPLFELSVTHLNKGNIESAHKFSKQCCDITCPDVRIITKMPVNRRLYDEIRWVLLYKLSKLVDDNENIVRARDIFKKSDYFVISSPHLTDPVLIKTHPSLNLAAGSEYELESLSDGYQQIIKRVIGSVYKENVDQNRGELSYLPFQEKTKGKKLYIVVRYRDRPEQLRKFVPHMTKYLKEARIDFEIWIMEQTDDGPFNHGIGYNIAAKLFEESGNWEDCYVCFHDVDLLPVKGVNYYYPEENTINHLHGSKNSLNMASVMHVKQFLMMNGTSNLYDIWGFDDNDMLRRVQRYGLRRETRFFTPRYSTHCFKEMDADKSAPPKKMHEDYTKINYNIFCQNYDAQDDGFRQIKIWKKFVKWIPWDKHYSQFKIDIAGIKEANNLKACMNGYEPQPDEYPPGLLQGKPFKIIEREWKTPPSYN